MMTNHKTYYRELVIDQSSIASRQDDSREIRLAFSSDKPVDRMGLTEILDHGADSVDLRRLLDGAPLLVNHDPGQVIGVVTQASIDPDRVGRATVRFGRSALAEEVYRDVIDGIRRHVSVGYHVQDVREEEGGVYRVVKWEPLEISIASIPLDPTVGVGRAIEQERMEKAMSEKPKVIDATMIESDAQLAERARVRDILTIGEKCGCAEDARAHIEAGTSADEFRQYVLENKWTHSDAVKEARAPEIGMSDREVRQYSIIRAINAAASNDWSKAGFELEASRAVEQAVHREPHGFYLPYDVQRRDYLSVGLTNHTGEHTIATNLLASSFIDMLRNSLAVNSMGARTLTGLVGDVAIPRQTGGATGYWLTEDADATASVQVFDQLTMTPKTVAGRTEMTRKLLQQSSLDVEALVRQDLAATLAAAIDVAALHSDGSANRPTGITGTAGIATVALGTNGGAPTHASIVQLETEVAVDNALMGSLGYLTNAKVRGKLKTTYTNATYGEIPLWQNGENGSGWLNGYRAIVSNQVSSTLTKGTSSGVCSAIFFGNWADLVIGMWGGLDVMVDPYSGSASGRVRVVLFQDMDMLIRHAQSFSVILDALTS